LNRLFAQAYESALFQYLPQARYSLASANLELAAEVRPRDPEVWYQLARVYALAREKKKALEALSKAFEYGFNDGARIEEDQSLDPLRDEAAYKRVVQQIANKRKP
jgi:Tfp pilus assembly protein PilF